MSSIGTVTASNSETDEIDQSESEYKSNQISSEDPYNLTYSTESEFMDSVIDRHISNPDGPLATDFQAAFTEPLGPDIEGERVGRIDEETDSSYATANHVIEIYELEEQSVNDEAMYVAWHWSIGSEDGNNVPIRSPRLTMMENQIEVNRGDLLYFEPDRTIQRDSSEVDIDVDLEGMYKGVNIGGKASTTFEYVTDEISPNMSGTSTSANEFMLEWDGRTTRTVSMEALSLFEGNSGYSVEGNFKDGGTAV
ncbi:hypothetical protein JCM18750_12300 [Halostagnicola bangensis]